MVTVRPENKHTLDCNNKVSEHVFTKISWQKIVSALWWMNSVVSSLSACAEIEHHP